MQTQRINRQPPTVNQNQEIAKTLDDYQVVSLVQCHLREFLRSSIGG